jgi:predicted RNA-binding protein with PIN domain
MPQKLIIDGYNVAFADERLRRMAIKDRSAARARFIEMLVAYVQQRLLHITLVFDGRGTMVDSDTLVPGKLQVVYSADNQTADDVIVSTIRRSGTPRAYIVVSSDNAVRTEARALGCEVLKAGRFLERLAAEPDRRDRRESKTRDLGDTDYWLERFERDSEE